MNLDYIYTLNLKELNNLSIDDFKLYKDFCKKDNFGNTLLITLCENYKKISLEIIELFKNEINILGNYNQSPLMYLIKYNNINITYDIIKKLYRKNIENIKGQNILMYYFLYVDKINMKIIKLFKDEIKNVDYDYNTSLIYYINCKKIDIKIAKYLYNRLDINYKKNKNLLIYYLEYSNKIDIEVIKELYIYVGIHDLSIYNIDLDIY